ncbi:MAG: hypothetical protein HDS52_10420 [Barnesiella sp.]|nr:hypothetical protein [Barnesiella sp.]
MLLTTSRFRIIPDTYIRRIMKRWVSRHAAILAILPALLIVLALTVNPLFLVVALMLAVVTVPAIMMLVYCNYGLMPRIVMMTAGDVGVTLFPDRIDIDVEREEAPGYSFSIPLSEVREITPGDPYDIIVNGPRPGDIVLIDHRAFPDRETRIRFHNYIFDNIQVNSHS